MIVLNAKIREKIGKGLDILRKEGRIPGVLYGSEIENAPIEVEEKEFEEIYKEAGESSLIKLKIKNQESKINEVEVLVHDISRDPITGRILHIDFYHPSSRKEVEAEVPLVFGGEAPAVKDLGGTLVKEIQSIEVKALPKDLPREIKVDISGLKTFEDRICVEDIQIPDGVTVLRDKKDIVALVVPPEEEEEITEEPAEVKEGETTESKKTEEKQEEQKEETST